MKILEPPLVSYPLVPKQGTIDRNENIQNTIKVQNVFLGFTPYTNFRSNKSNSPYPNCI